MAIHALNTHSETTTTTTNMEDVEVVQLVPTAREQIVVSLCHRSCWYVEVASVRRASTGAAPGQFADLPVASMTGAWGRQC